MNVKTLLAASVAIGLSASLANAVEIRSKTVIDNDTDNETTGSIVIKKKHPDIVIRKDEPTVIIKKRQPDVVIHNGDDEDNAE